MLVVAGLESGRAQRSLAEIVDVVFGHYGDKICQRLWKGIRQWWGFGGLESSNLGGLQNLFEQVISVLKGYFVTPPAFFRFSSYSHFRYCAVKLLFTGMYHFPTCFVMFHVLVYSAFSNVSFFCVLHVFVCRTFCCLQVYICWIFLLPASFDM